MSDTGMVTICVANEIITATSSWMPRVRQKYPRVSVHDRTIAARIGSRSSTIAAGTNASFVPSQSATAAPPRIAEDHDAERREHRRPRSSATTVERRAR